MTMYADIPLNNIMYDVKEHDGVFDRSEWNEAKKDLIQSKPLINLPYIIINKKDKESKTESESDTSTDRVVTQSNACFSHLGRALNLWGNNNEEITSCEEYLCELMDIRNNTVSYMYTPNSTIENATKYLNKISAIGNSFDKISKSHVIKCATTATTTTDTTDNVCYLIGNHATAPDFHLYEMLHQNKSLADFYNLPDPFLNQPILNQFFIEFKKLKKNQKYLNSNIGKNVSVPFNQKNAGFGGTPSGGVWTNNMEYTYNNYIGLM